MDKGFLYVANNLKFVEEARISVKSLRRFNTEAVALICTPDLYQKELELEFDKIITVPALEGQLYLAKIIGLQHTPFEKTIFLDGDTFVTDTISELYELLELVDFATTIEHKIHTSKRKDIAFRGFFPEFNTGVIVFKNNAIMQKIFRDWLDYCMSISLRADMPGLREAVIKNFRDVHFSILPDCYNEHGFATMMILFNKVKIIHERMEYEKGTYTPQFKNFDRMHRFALKINRIEGKRLYVPKIGVISYRWSPQNLITYVKKKMGYKRVSKNR